MRLCPSGGLSFHSVKGGSFQLFSSLISFTTWQTPKHSKFSQEAKAPWPAVPLTHPDPYRPALPRPGQPMSFQQGQSILLCDCDGSFPALTHNGARITSPRLRQGSQTSRRPHLVCVLREMCYPHSTGKETEAQRRAVTWPHGVAAGVQQSWTRS